MPQLLCTSRCALLPLPVSLRSYTSMAYRHCGHLRAKAEILFAFIFVAPCEKRKMSKCGIREKGRLEYRWKENEEEDITQNSYPCYEQTLICLLSLPLIPALKLNL